MGKIKSRKKKKSRREEICAKWSQPQAAPAGQGVETTPLHLGAAWGQLARVPDLAGSRLRPEVVIPGAGQAQFLWFRRLKVFRKFLGQAVVIVFVR